MSHSVVRGEPFASQLYLDGILDEILRSRADRDVTTRAVRDVTTRDTITLPQVLLHCLRKHPLDVLMINAVSGEKTTNEQILKLAIPIARAFVAKGARGKNTMIMMSNHVTSVVVYFATLFAGTVPFTMYPYSKVFEIIHFLKIVEPSIVYCDEEHYLNVIAAVNTLPELEIEVKQSNSVELLTELASGHSGEIDNFQVPDVDVDSTVMMLMTSGSTGMPKATLMTHRGMITQLPMNWIYFKQFPKPTKLVMLHGTPQWLMLTRMLFSCLVYRVPVLMSQRSLDVAVEWINHALVTYRPTWTYFEPSLANTLLPTLTKDHLSSLETLLVLGTPSSIEMKTALRVLLPESASLVDVYGSTETHGYIAYPEPGAPLKSNGRVLNIFDYMLVDEDGKKVGLCQNGELYIKGASIIKGYLKNQEAFEETFTDGWFRTGDAFYIDERERLFYLERKKFCFKYMECQISPEEVELVVGSVPGVERCVVCPTDAGPAAAVVPRADCTVSREQIHKAVNDTLIDHKHLHGGIAFVVSLPHTHSGKLKRDDCNKLMAELLAAGHCY